MYRYEVYKFLNVGGKRKREGGREEGRDRDICVCVCVRVCVDYANGLAAAAGHVTAQ
jgi:hypothetical protein